MTEIPFDTMVAARRLRDSGISEEQAEAITQTMRDSITGGVATKADLAEVKTDISALKADVAEVKTDISALKADVAEVKTDISALKADMAEVKTDISALKADMAELEAELKTDISELKAELKTDVIGIKAELKWMKLIGGAILAVLILPWLAEIVSSTLP